MSETLQEKAARLYVPGTHGYAAVARELGVSPQTVRRWVDPEYYERCLHQSREAKQRRRTSCEICGVATWYTSRVCSACLGDEVRIWTRETIIAAIRAWVSEHGRPPSADDWRRADPDQRYPAVSSVYRSTGPQNQPFAQWADAIEAAGFERPENGGRYRERPWLWKFDHARALELIATGMSQSEVARQLGVSQSSISQLVLQNGTYAQRKAA